MKTLIKNATIINEGLKFAKSNNKIVFNVAKEEK